MSTTSSTGSVTSSSSTNPSTSALGVGSGLDLNSIIDGLMKIEALGQDKLKSKVTDHNNVVSVYQQLNSKVSTLLTASQGLNLPTSWQIKAATSSSDNVGATASNSAISGSLSFIVKNLASAETLASNGTVASTSTVIASGDFLVGKGGSLGLGSVTGTGLTQGAHTLAVTQASTGASQSGSSPLSSSITFAGGETITLNNGGTPTTVTMTAGTYNRSQLAQMITDNSGGAVKATLNNDLSLKLTTANEGSASSLQITGGTALGTLGLAAGGVSNGTDGIVTVDGVANTVTDIRADGSNSVVLNGTAGTVNASFSGGLRVGTADYKSVSVGDGSLSSVVSAINGANMGVTAAAIQVTPGAYKLQLQSSTTGSAGKISADLSSLAGALGSFQAVNEAKDATLQVGTGAGAYSITSTSNTVSNVLPGVTLTLSKADPSTTVTVNVGGDVDSLTNKVLAMVNSANDAMKFIKDNSKYDQKTKASGYLLGNSTSQRLQQGMFSAMSSTVSGGSLSAASQVGITINEDGTFSFDTAKFKAAYQNDPQAVSSLFVEGGANATSSSGTNPGIAERIANIAKLATDSVDGTITTAIKGENTTISDLQKQIDSWDQRLAQRRQNLLTQFTAMDTAVANFKAQSTWLAGQISHLG